MGILGSGSVHMSGRYAKVRMALCILQDIEANLFCGSVCSCYACMVYTQGPHGLFVSQLRSLVWSTSYDVPDMPVQKPVTGRLGAVNAVCQKCLQVKPHCVRVGWPVRLKS